MIVDVLVIYLIAINFIAFILYGIDKRKAQLKKWRIPESTLIGIAIIGGCYGALIGMFFFKHKTLKRKFKCIIPLVVILYTFVIGKIIN